MAYFLHIFDLAKDIYGYVACADTFAYMHKLLRNRSIH